MVSLPASHDYSSLIIAPDKSESLSNEDQQRAVFVSVLAKVIVHSGEVNTRSHSLT